MSCQRLTLLPFSKSNDKKKKSTDWKRLGRLPFPDKTKTTTVPLAINKHEFVVITYSENEDNIKHNKHTRHSGIWNYSTLNKSWQCLTINYKTCQ